MRLHAQSAWTIHIMLFSLSAALMTRAAGLTSATPVTGTQIVWIGLKSRVDTRNNSSESRSSFPENSDSLILGLRPRRGHSSEPSFEGSRMRNGLADEVHEHYSSDENNEGTSAASLEALASRSEEPNRNIETRDDDIVEMGPPETSRERSGCEEGNLSDLGMNLKCPLCRGAVRGWKIVKEARQYLDLKRRGCSRESCSFFGNYRELRRHARRVHPTTRPADVDPSRQRAWRHLEHQREYGDIVSAIRSAMPGAVVLGDYVIESGDGHSLDRESSASEGPWWTTFFLFQMFAPVEEQRGLVRAWNSHRRSSGSLSSHRNLWGENLLGLHDDEDDWNVASDTGEDVPPVPRRRRRLTRSRPNEDQL
ncbi:uncharacterized protein LOC122667620 isoform X1 [Telopea speciosissima]|uniref:uncharacterized protein LOC122667620 isoform X1 n=1 Tax=Telopea speciosissima TaxID=54955 RepID=UPI001CC75ABF|nr:uncharacterized protein LOC122667620 isoform X1 [Telopea speciosissima]XP_043719907.1 uncharacterized protein LOC122667620 isoform X1 [Telopea speciosissima]XP_043719908.1 uncharacterized protein LOC122667620 isoform X1 [Telopea speciosissima]XP_043719909.1 uncharacterized protein LOC122667620 isoform X1 [Telopea speciosissima]